MFHDYAKDLRITDDDPDWVRERSQHFTNTADGHPVTDKGRGDAGVSAVSEKDMVHEGDTQAGQLVELTYIGVIPGSHGAAEQLLDTPFRQQPSAKPLDGSVLGAQSSPHADPEPQSLSPQQASEPGPGRPLGEGTEDPLTLTSVDLRGNGGSEIRVPSGASFLSGPRLRVLSPGSPWVMVQQAMREGRVAALRANKQYSTVSASREWSGLAYPD